MGICNNFVLCRVLTTHGGIHIVIFLFSFNAKHKHTGTKNLINNIIQARCGKKRETLRFVFFRSTAECYTFFTSRTSSNAPNAILE